MGEPGYRLWTDQRPKNGRRLILTGMEGIEGDRLWVLGSGRWEGNERRLGIRAGVGLGFTRNKKLALDKLGP